jgi:hypothetical protein
MLAAAGPDVAAITPAVNAFWAVLGSLNANIAGSFGSGRREINGISYLLIFSDPNLLPSKFFQRKFAAWRGVFHALSILSALRA